MVHSLLETFGRENFVNRVGEISPANVGSLLRCLEVLSELLELALGDRALRHCEADAELSSSDVARSQSVEVAEELGDADALLLAPGADTSDHIIDVVRGVADNFSLADASLRLRVVVRAVVEALANAEKLITTVDILAEVHVVALVDIAFVHVTFEEILKDVLRCTDSEEIQDAKELLLGYVPVASDVVVLEDGLQVDAIVLDLDAVLFEDVLDLLVHWGSSEVLPASQ